MKGVDRAVVHATHVTTGRETKAGNTMLVQNNRLELTQRGHSALCWTIRVDQIDRGIMAFEHENFSGPLPSTIDYARDKSKFIVSCVEDCAQWAYLFYEWANELPVTEMQETTPDMDDESDTDEESTTTSSDLFSHEEDAYDSL